MSNRFLWMCRIPLMRMLVLASSLLIWEEALHLGFISLAIVILELVASYNYLDYLFFASSSEISRNAFSLSPRPTVLSVLSVLSALSVRYGHVIALWWDIIEQTRRGRCLIDFNAQVGRISLVRCSDETRSLLFRCQRTVNKLRSRVRGERQNPKSERQCCRCRKNKKIRYSEQEGHDMRTSGRSVSCQSSGKENLETWGSAKLTDWPSALDCQPSR